MSERVRLTIDGKEIEVPAGRKVLWAALENGIYIPHLCALPDEEPPFAACRLCFVEIEGISRPVTACTQEVAAGMVIRTRSGQLDRLVRTGFEMIMSNHRIECKTCPANGRCELQKIAKERKWPLKPKRLPGLDRALPVDTSAPGIVYDPNKCVLCGRCVRVCRQKGLGDLGFAHRGFQRIVTTFGGRPLGEAGCLTCGACASACPVGALAAKKE
ncbi:MAG: (2Fe-2S)-binding protein [Firmicutes bacterium]|nr:(2Fe-2S)-binding protein [Bacillota bacterium]